MTIKKPLAIYAGSVEELRAGDTVNVGGTTGTGNFVLDTAPTISDMTIGGANPFVDFNDGTSVTLAAGRLWYNGTTGSWNLGMGGGNITQQVGEELFVYGKASSAITDSPLQIVYQTGTVGASGVIQFAPTTTGITNGDLIIGVATEPIALNGFGRVTCFGVVHGITTNGTAYGETWADGDTIWYNPTTGNPTKTKPSAPNIKVQIGTVISAGSGGSGSFQVEINHGSVLGGTDSNVQLTSPTSGDLLRYDGTKWINTATIPVSNITATGTPSSTTYLRGDGSWSTPAGGGSSVTVGTSAPSSPSAGALWWDSTYGMLKIYYTDANTSQWVAANGSYIGSTSASLANVTTSISGVLKGNGTGVVAATSGTDFAPATSGTSLLRGSGTGGFTNVTLGTNLSFTGNTLNATGGATPGGTVTGAIQYRTSTGTLGGTDYIKIDPACGWMYFNTQNPTGLTVPATTDVVLGAYKVANAVDGKPMLGMFSNYWLQFQYLQPWIAQSNIAIFKGLTGSATVPSAIGLSLTGTGTATAATWAATNLHTYTNRTSWRATASTTAVAGFRGAAATYAAGASSGIGGYLFVCRWGPGATGSTVATHRAFVGLRASTSAPTDVAPSTLTNCIGMGWDSGDANLQLYVAGTTFTKWDTGIARTAGNETELYDITIYIPSGSGTSSPYNMYIEIFDVVSGNAVSPAINIASVATTQPSSTTGLNPYGYVSAGGTSAAVSFDLMSLYIETEI